MKIKISSISYLLFAFALVFADVLNNGNLNLLYFATVLLIIFNMVKKKYFYREEVKYLLPIIVIAIVNALFSDIGFSTTKALVYIAKMALCIAMMIYLKNNLANLKIKNEFTYVVYLLGIVLVVALLLRGNTTLWRLNDTTNGFSVTRLQLLYSEPSVLGIFSGLILLFSLNSGLENGVDKLTCTSITVSVVCLILSFSLSGIVYTTMASVVLIIIKFFKKISNRKIRNRVFIVAFIVLMAIIIVLTTNNQISNRIVTITNGQDGSFTFRWNRALIAINEIMSETHFLGLGFGNMNTRVGLQILLNSGMDYKFSNSFLYFIAEVGIIGLLYILFIVGACVKAIGKELYSWNDNISDFKFSLLIYVILIQIAGGYFTDPTMWMIYGIILSKGLKKESLML